MRIFYYTWHENSAQDLYETFTYLKYDVVKCHIPFSNYHDDEVFMSNLEKIFNEHQCDIFFSFDFFPTIAKVAEKIKKHYISWVYDMPHITLYSPSVKSEFVSVFVFDKMQYFEMLSRKPEQTYHMPLAVNTRRLNGLLGTDIQQADFKYDVSFVGSLYEKNLYRSVEYLPEFIRGYIQGIAESQKKIYGCNIVKEMLTGDILKILQKCIKLDLDSVYEVDERQIYTNLINKEITAQERFELLKAVSERFNFTLFSGSTCEELPQDIFAGTVSYDKEMPRVFRETKINLNITLRSIISGIPLRALDVMGAGGFLLTNYQPEIAEYFVDGEEVVMFDSKEDMLNKIAYYLEHEEERKQIAYNGWKKVQEQFSYEKQVNEILKQVIYQ